MAPALPNVIRVPDRANLIILARIRADLSKSCRQRQGGMRPNRATTYAGRHCTVSLLP
jgi:hypothetical protein